MANPDDPVTHAELSALLDEKLQALKSIVTGAVPAADDDDDDDGPLEQRFTLSEMESYAERQVKKAVRDLAKKAKPAAPAPKVDDDEGGDDDKDAEVEKVEKVEPVKVAEPTPDPQPGKKSKQEKWWGK